MKKINITRFLSAVLLLLGCGSDDTNPPLEPESALAELAESVGGLDALGDLVRFRTVGSGIDRIEDEGRTPDALLGARMFRNTSAVDLSLDALRIDIDATLAFKLLSGAPQVFTEWVVAGASATTDGEHAFGAPGGARTSDRAASTTRRLELLNPALLIRRLEEADVSRGEPVDVGGIAHRVYSVTHEGLEDSFVVNASTGELAEVRFQESHRLRRDVDVVVSYRQWSSDAIQFPGAVEIMLNGHVVSEFSRSELDLSPTFSPDLFESPGLGDVAATESDRGRRSHHFNQAFSSIGLPSDGIETEVTAAEFATGLYLVTGALHNLLVIEQENGLLIVDAPLGPERAAVVIDWLAATFPAKPVTHVIPSHFHQDHSAGVREFVAGGARLVVADRVRAHWDGILSAQSTILPDALSVTGRPVAVDAVADGATLVLSDLSRPTSVSHIPDNVHADDLVLVTVPSDGVTYVFVADIYAPGIGSLSPTGPLEFVRGLQAHGLLESDCASPTPLAVVGAHGGVEPIATTIDFMRSAGIDLSSIGCN